MKKVTVTVLVTGTVLLLALLVSVLMLSAFNPPKNSADVYWEVPIIKVGDSIMPINSGNDDLSQILVVKSFSQLNSLRVMVGSPNISRPITHNYTSSFFKDSALIFVTVYTSSGGHVPYIKFQGLVTDEYYFYPVFELDLPEGGGGWTADIGQRSFLIEVSRAVVDKHKVGSLGMGRGWHANWNKFDCDKVVWLSGENKGGWEFTSPSDDWGIRVGADDSVLIRKDYKFFITKDRVQWTGGFGGPHSVYIKRPGMNDFEYILDAWGDGNVYLLSLGLLDGTNVLKVVGDNMAYSRGQYVRAYDFFEIKKAAGHVETSYQFDVSILNGDMRMGITWDSEDLFAAYVKRADSESFEKIATIVSGTRGVRVDAFEFSEGTNIVQVETYKFVEGKAVQSKARYTLVLSGEKKQVNYNFKLVGGGLPNSGYWTGGHGLTWEGGTNQFYERYIKRSNADDFEDIGSGPSSWAVLLNDFDFCEGMQTFRIEGWEFSNGILRRIFSDYSFEVKYEEYQSISFVLSEGRLLWDYASPWHIHSVSVKRAGSDHFDLVNTLATGGLNPWNGIELSSLGLTEGTNVIRVGVAWSANGNVLSNKVGYYTVNV